MVERSAGEIKVTEGGSGKGRKRKGKREEEGKTYSPL
jgi:hypothetical protein